MWPRVTRPDHAETDRILLDAMTQVFILRTLRKAGSPLTIRQVAWHAGLWVYEAEAMLQALCREGVAERAPDAGRAWRYQATARPDAAAGDGAADKQVTGETVSRR
jgi:hypothetical protein